MDQDLPIVKETIETLVEALEPPANFSLITFSNEAKVGESISPKLTFTGGVSITWNDSGKQSITEAISEPSEAGVTDKPWGWSFCGTAAIAGKEHWQQSACCDALLGREGEQRNLPTVVLVRLFVTESLWQEGNISTFAEKLACLEESRQKHYYSLFWIHIGAWSCSSQVLFSCIE